jgi:hypothetical protein
MQTLEKRLIERVEYYQKMERLARVWKNSTASYHKTKSEAFQEALKILKEVEG